MGMGVTHYACPPEPGLSSLNPEKNLGLRVTITFCSVKELF